ncbi:MAG: DUF3383 family protein [Schwartzia sp. (in: firmicutes)]
MPLKNVLPINPVVNVIVNLSTISAPRKAFNLACLMGDVGSVADFSVARVVTYDSLEAMLQAGFKTSDRLYQAASLLLGQQKKPPLVAIGKVGQTVRKTAGRNTYTVTNKGANGNKVTFEGKTFTAGTEFQVGADEAETVANLAEALSSDSDIKSVYTVVADGAVLTVTEIAAGEGHTPGAMTATGKLAISAGTATTSQTAEAAETPMETMQACRQANYEWYVGIYCGDMTDDQIEEVAQYVESATPDTVFAYTTEDEKVKQASDGGIFSRLQSRQYRRSIGQYSTSHKDAIAAVVGWAMGAMTGTINSAYTLAYKTEVGVQAENYMQTFTSNDVNTVKGFNGNLYINRGTYYNIFEEGKMADGSWFDEIIYLDKMKNDMQLGIMDLLVQNNKLPQTEAGMTRIKNALKEVCESYNRIGFIAPGVWKSNDIMRLTYGDTLPGGYFIQSEPVDEQLQADRDARKAPPIYVCLKLAGAIHHVTVQADVNR